MKKDSIQILSYLTTNSGNLKIYAPNFKDDLLAVTGLNFSQEDIRNIFVEKKGVIAFATLGDVLIGVAMVYFIEDVPFIQNVAVLPQFRRMGVARKLVSMLVVDLRMMGIEEVFISCEIGNKAASELYSSLGFNRRSMQALGEYLFQIEPSRFLLPISTYGTRIALM